MPILINDSILEREILVSNDRLNKPNFVDKEKKDECPFCTKNEDKIEKTIFSYGNPWRVKVVVNKYPILSDNSKLDIHGVHYVVIEGQKHNKSIGDFTEEDFKDIFTVYKKIVEDLEKNQDIKYIQIFKNYKKEAGISIEHQHSQIVALNIMPKFLRNKKKQSIQFLGHILFNGECFNLIVPREQIMDYTLRIYSKIARTSFSQLTNKEIIELSKIFKLSIYIINEILGDIAMNVCYYFCGKDNNKLNFFVDIIPRKSGIAGFELATGMMINTMDSKTCYSIYNDILKKI